MKGGFPAALAGLALAALAGSALFSDPADEPRPQRGKPSGSGAVSSPRAATAGASRAPATGPAPTSAPSEADCRRAGEALLARLDGSFRAAVRPPFVVIGNLPRERLDALADGSVVAPAKAMWNTYFRRRPTDAIAVLAFADDPSYRKWAKALFGDEDLPHFGYYKPSRRVLVMNIATGTGTLVHELTHALIEYDFPDVPTWFNEGLASLHEQCSVQAEGIVGMVNWRLPGLQKALRERTLRPLRDLMTAGDFRGAGQGLNYAHARYFVMYMQQRQLLGKFYARFREQHAGADSAVQAVERVFGTDIAKVEADFLRWVMTLQWPER